MFQSPICGSQTERATCAYSHCKHVSIPYMRVTNDIAVTLQASRYAGFNPLYAGHKQCKKRGKENEGNVSIPYMRVTNQGITGGTLLHYFVSIPYMRVTNGAIPSDVIMSFVFQSPICGSQTRSMKTTSIYLSGFNPLYAGHKRERQLSIYVKEEVSIPYMRVTNVMPCLRPKGGLTFQSPICGSQTHTLERKRRKSFMCFNPLYAGHKLYPFGIPCRLIRQFQSPICGSQTQKDLLSQWVEECFNPLYAGHKLCGGLCWCRS